LVIRLKYYHTLESNQDTSTQGIQCIILLSYLKNEYLSEGVSKSRVVDRITLGKIIGIFKFFSFFGGTGVCCELRPCVARQALHHLRHALRLSFLLFAFS
jgi:hypothetical protein